MQRFITDERTGIQYELIGDYYYPCLTIENEEPPTLTKYGRMRERYLREHRKILYINLLTSGKLYEHLAEIDTSACNMAEYLIKEMARKQGVTEELKGKDMITQPKTPKSIRVITMPDFLAEEFREYCSHLYGIMKKERLFRFTKSHMEHCMATGIERSGVKRIRLHDLRHSHARNRRVFLPTGIKRWTESEKYGKISIRNDIVKSEFIKEDMDETVFMFALFKCRKFDKRRN